MLQKWLEYDTQASWEKLISAISSLDDNDDDNADETIAGISIYETGTYKYVCMYVCNCIYLHDLYVN